MEGQERILVIDDDESLQKSCRMVFSREGYAVEPALDGISGLEKHKRFQPDLVLVDLKMPGLGGLDVLKKLKQADPDCVAIVITGYGTIESAVEAMKRGAYDFLPKPFGPDQLRIIVRRGLERRRFIRETARLRREKELMRNNFISMVSHELRSPLNAVQQNLMVITSGLGGEISGQARQTILSMQTRIKALISLINDWLSLARIESGEILGSKEPVDLRATLSEVIETLAPLADERQVSLEVTASPDLHRITGNKQALLMLFTNLIHNGIKYNRQGGRVETELRRLDGSVEARIKDTGVGISSEDLPLIFEQFYRVKGEGRTEGSGLGLSISRRIVEAHSGTIDVQSEPGKGTVFRVCLPTGSAPE
jgi:two-component system sensor histidine kinase/response regulator